MSNTTPRVMIMADDASFDEEVLGATGPVLVEFFAPWCGNCHRILPVLQQLAGEFTGRVRFVQINVEENPQLGIRFGVSATPTLVLFYEGVRADTVVGAQPEAVLCHFVTTAAIQPDGDPEPVPAGWVPADACTLPSADQPLRVAEFHDLFTTALNGVERRGPGWLRLHMTADPQVEPTTRNLVERESDCCAFFDFQLDTTSAGELTLDIRVPPGRGDVLDGLSRQAEAAGTTS